MPPFPKTHHQMKRHQKRQGLSYQKRVADINRIYDLNARSGLSNREIWRRFIYPRFGISERTFYNILKAPAKPKNNIPRDLQLYLDFSDPPP